ncbi:protein FAR1-RELATED SEQUENCE 5-like [Chenopodium quinoa]|uniref:protein FAR1-RELATED SEQUENCE 5-like n=1 Tax=Chenopodium quinoa TaxID=63459 RepID=UPI000B76E415|nr:protein FAR1-RELATED SEQUENCE 5-like [Chenopodium quinoa]
MGFNINGHDSQNDDVEINNNGNEEANVEVNDQRSGHDSENEDDEFNIIGNEEVDDEVNNIRNGHDFQNGSNGEEQQSRIPAVGMNFASGEEFTRFCHMYAFEKGFEYFVRTCIIMDEYREKGVHHRGVGDKEPKDYMMSRIRLLCKMGTKDRRKKKTGRKISSPPPGCKVLVEARLSVDGRIYIKNCELSHNHDLFPNDSRLMVNYRGIDDGAYENMVLNDSAGISMTKSFNSIVIARGGQQNVTVNKSDLRNAVNIVRRRVIFGGDADAADTRARAQYKDFGDIVSFDTTFLTNKYQMPFAPFVGCNHHGSSIILGAALVSNENLETFEWVFNQWLQCMGKPPKGIITDQCKAIGKAVKKIAHRNLGKLEKFIEIQADLKVVVHDSLFIEEFEDSWKHMVTKYRLQNNDWINDTFENREHWAPSFWRGSFWAGMSSTQRSEGQNRCIKGYVSLNTGLLQFMNQFEQSNKKKVKDEKDLNFQSHSNPFEYDNTILAECVFSNAYTNKKFLEVRDEVIGLRHTNVLRTENDGNKVLYDAEEKIPIPVWKARRKLFKVSVDKDNEFLCLCKLFEFCGILCRHLISAIEKEDIDFTPSKYILDRWRKSVVRGYEGISVSYYDPNDSIKLKKQNEINVRHQYLSSFAMHSELVNRGCYSATLEAVIGIRSTNGVQDWSDPSMNRVFGRHRLRPKELNQQNLQQNAKPPEERNIKDPVVKRGSGRAQTTRNKHPSEEGSKKRKMKNIQEPDDEGEDDDPFHNGIFVDTNQMYGVNSQQHNGNMSSVYGAQVQYGYVDPRGFYQYNSYGGLNQGLVG